MLYKTRAGNHHARARIAPMLSIPTISVILSSLAPFIKYDILHVLDTLSQVTSVRDDSRPTYVLEHLADVGSLDEQSYTFVTDYSLTMRKGDMVMR